MTPQSAYRLRQRGDAASFAVAWQQALTHAVHRLADAALSRALHGVATPIFYKGEQIGERRKYDENLTRFLLRLRAPENYEDLPRNMKVNSLRPAGVEFDRAKQRLLDPDAPGLDRDLVDQDGYDQNADGEDGRDEDRYGEDGRDEDGYDEDSDDCAADGSELS